GAIAWALAAAIAGAWSPFAIAAFVLAALLRAGCGLGAEVKGFDAGAAARRRLRTEGLARALAAPGAGASAGELAATLADGVEAFDGLHARWAAAAMLAVLGPVLVGGVALVVDPLA